MCSISKPSPPPAPEPIPVAPPAPSPVVANRTTKKDAPKLAKSTSSITKADNTAMKKRRGRGSLRIPLTSSGLSGSGVQFPTA